MAHGRDESANSCTMCGFNYVLKKRARFYELISYRGKQALPTPLPPSCKRTFSLFGSCKGVLNGKQECSGGRRQSRSEERSKKRKEGQEGRRKARSLSGLPGWPLHCSHVNLGSPQSPTLICSNIFFFSVFKFPSVPADRGSDCHHGARGPSHALPLWIPHESLCPALWL